MMGFNRAHEIEVNGEKEPQSRLRGLDHIQLFSEEMKIMLKTDNSGLCMLNARLALTPDGIQFHMLLAH